MLRELIDRRNAQVSLWLRPRASSSTARHARRPGGTKHRTAWSEGRRALAFVLAALTILSGLVFTSSEVAQAAEPTVENPVLFEARGEAVSGGLKYYLNVIGVYNQTYESVNIIYPAELQLVAPDSRIAATWNTTNSDNGTTKTTSWIIKSGNRSAADLKLDLQSIYLELAGSAYPPEGSKISVKASRTKTVTYADLNEYIHYYEWVPFNSNVPITGGANPCAQANGCVNWWEAYNAAKARTMQDPRSTNPADTLTGYLATITSEEEQMTLYGAIADYSGWLGGTRQKLSGQKIQDKDTIPVTVSGSTRITTVANAGTAGYTYPDDTSFHWYWADGPEAWVVQSSGQYTYYPRAGCYDAQGKWSACATTNPNYKSWATVPADSWVVHDEITDKYAFFVTSATKPELTTPKGTCSDAKWNNKKDECEGGGNTFTPTQTVMADPNRGAAIVPLEFYNRHIYVAGAAGAKGTDYPIAGVYHNFNNPGNATANGTSPNNYFDGTAGGWLHYFAPDKTYLGKRQPVQNAEPNGTSSEYVLQFAYPSNSHPDLAADQNIYCQAPYSDDKSEGSLWWQYCAVLKKKVWQTTSALNTTAGSSQAAIAPTGLTGTPAVGDYVKNNGTNRYGEITAVANANSVTVRTIGVDASVTAPGYRHNVRVWATTTALNGTMGSTQASITITAQTGFYPAIGDYVKNTTTHAFGDITAIASGTSVTVRTKGVDNTITVPSEIQAGAQIPYKNGWGASVPATESGAGRPDTWNDYAGFNTSSLYGYFVEYGGYRGILKLRS